MVLVPKGLYSEALSGIFARNAQGTVWFLVGSHVDPDTKVFAVAEVHVLRRNPDISRVSKKHPGTRPTLHSTEIRIPVAAIYRLDLLAGWLFCSAKCFLL